MVPSTPPAGSIGLRLYRLALRTLPQDFRDVALDYHLGQSLNDSCLAHTGLTQEHGIIFGTAA